MKHITSSKNRLHRYYFIIIFLSCVTSVTVAQEDQLPYETVDNACNKCSCTEKEGNQPSKFYVLNCIGKGFKQILAGYPEIFDLSDNATRIDMSFTKNQIAFLNKLPATGTSVSFSCRHCGIKDISTGVFIDVPNILKVDFSWNELTELRAEIFKGRHNDKVYEPIGLMELDLSHNLLETLDRSLFEHLPSLKVLKLSYNPLNFEHLSTIAAIGSLKNIQKLNLAYTGIATLPVDIFGKHLRELNIHGNKFVTVPESLSLAEVSLQSLFIGGNSIKEIKNESFLGMVSLRNLHLNDMESLENIEPNAFVNLTALESLHCTNNTNLTSINIESLKSSVNLRTLDISNCSLNTLEVSYSNSNDSDDDGTMFPNLKFFKMDNNPWHCNCSLFKSLQRIVKFDQNVFQSENTARCSTPYELASDLLVDITVDTLCLVSNTKKQREPVFDPPPFLRPRSILFSLLSILIVVLIGLCIGFSIVLIKKKLNKNEIGFSSPIRYTTVRNSTISVG